jgi:UPF0755 protein
MQRLGRVIFTLLVPTAALVGAWQGWQWWSWANRPMDLAQGDTAMKAVQVQIERGTSARQIGRDLERLGIIRSSAAWELWARWLTWNDDNGGFQAGTYELLPTAPMTDVAQQLWQGKTIQQSLTIPEGWTVRQMADYFQSQGVFRAEEFLALAQKIPRDRYPWLPQRITSLEGFLFPDTYQFPGDTITPQAVIDSMLDRFEKVALPLWNQNRGQTKLDLLGWVTLSSIVEKEAVIPQERSVIAGVFSNRLSQGQKLESDPTVEYALKIRQTPDRPLTFTDIRQPSPYNTYLNPGLPPGPIAAPGKASLEATLAPAKTDYLFFVARYDGTHVFSKTLAEHEAAVKRIRAERNARTRSTPQPAASPSP